MPAKKRPTKSDTPAKPVSVTPAVTPNAVVAAKKEAATPVTKAKPAAKRPAAKGKTVASTAAAVEAVAVAPVAPVTEKAVIEVPVVADSPATPVRSVISEDDIRRQAYLLSRGRRGPGDPIADWFEAERQLREQRA